MRRGRGEGGPRLLQRRAGGCRQGDKGRSCLCWLCEGKRGQTGGRSGGLLRCTCSYVMAARLQISRLRDRWNQGQNVSRAVFKHKQLVEWVCACSPVVPVLRNHRPPRVLYSTAARPLLAPAYPSLTSPVPHPQPLVPCSLSLLPFPSPLVPSTAACALFTTARPLLAAARSWQVLGPDGVQRGDLLPLAWHLQEPPGVTGEGVTGGKRQERSVPRATRKGR